jgi:hypothetical protein
MRSPTYLSAALARLVNKGAEVNAKREAKLRSIVGPLLTDGERIVAVTNANVGRVSVKRQIATTTIVAVVSLGTIAAAVRPTPRYLVLTDRRLLFFALHPVSGGPMDELIAQIDRKALSVDSQKKGLLAHSLVLAIAGEEQGLDLGFGRLFAKADDPFIAALVGGAESRS